MSSTYKVIFSFEISVGFCIGNYVNVCDFFKRMKKKLEGTSWSNIYLRNNHYLKVLFTYFHMFTYLQHEIYNSISYFDVLQFIALHWFTLIYINVK